MRGRPARTRRCGEKDGVRCSRKNRKLHSSRCGCNKSYRAGRASQAVMSLVQQLTLSRAVTRKKRLNP